MLRKFVTSSAFVLAFSLVAFGARFTDNLDSLESTVQGLQDGLPVTLDKDQKKALKAYKSTLKKLGKDTDSLKKDVKLAKSVVGKLSKLGDPSVDAALDDAANEIAFDVVAALNAAQDKLDGVATKVSAAKVQKQIDAGFDALEASSGEEKQTKRFALLAKAESRARKADKLAGKVGGGGGGDCLGTAIGPEDTVTITRNGGDFGADKVRLRTFADDFRTGTQVTFSNCDGDVLLDIVFPDPITVGGYSGGAITGDRRVSFFAGPLGPGFGISNFSGQATVTSVEGRLQFTFTWETGGSESRFDGPYVGTIDIPALE